MCELEKVDILWIREELEEHDRFFEKLQERVPRNTKAGLFINNAISTYIDEECIAQLNNDSYIFEKIEEEYASDVNYACELSCRSENARNMIINVYLCYINNRIVYVAEELFLSSFRYANEVKISYHNIAELNLILEKCGYEKVSRYFDPKDFENTHGMGVQLSDIARVSNVARRHKRFFESIVTSLSVEKVNEQSTNFSKICRVICKEINDYVYEINDLVTRDIDSFMEWVNKNNSHDNVDVYIDRLNDDIYFAKNFIINAYVYDFLNFPVELSVKDDNYDAYFSFGYEDFNTDLYDTHGYDLEEINLILGQAGLEKLESKGKRIW